MAQLVSVAKAASGLSHSLFDHAEDSAFGQLEQTAFKSDALGVVSATQAMAVSPAFGVDSPSYDNALNCLATARTACDAAIPTDPLSIHRARLDVIAAIVAMQAVTAKPAVTVS